MNAQQIAAVIRYELGPEPDPCEVLAAIERECVVVEQGVRVEVERALLVLVVRDALN